MSQTKINTALTPEEAIRELWFRGKLSYKLHATQKKMLEAYTTNNQKVTTIACSRRLGKTMLLCVIAVEKCIQQEKAIVKFLCPEKNQVQTNIKPLMDDIFKDCPEELKPVYLKNAYRYEFPNGSQIQLAGTDGGHHESLRGSKADLWIIDEAGFTTDLKYIVRSVLNPTTLTTGGRGILASTPSKTVDHDFIEHFLTPAELEGKLLKYTIYDNPLLSKEAIQEVIRDFPLGVKDPEFRREYLCEVIYGSDRTIFPEFKEVKEQIVTESDRPPFYDAYVSMDIGGAGLGKTKKDLTVILFAYYDFKNARLVVEDELVAQGQDLLSNRLAQLIRRKEEALWTNKMSGEFRPPYLRIADNNNPIMLNELMMKENMLFIQTRKDNKQAAINTVRVMLADKRIIIHPRCETLIKHLEKGTWAKNKKDFARSAENAHYDSLDSLIYMVRNVQEQKNPYPAGYGFNAQDSFTPFAQKEHSPKEQAWINLFKSRSSIKRQGNY